MIFMQISLPISTGLMRGLTTPRVLPVRVLIATAASLGTLIFTMRPVLVSETWRRIVSEQDIKLAMRRLAWYGAKRSRNLEFISDPSFNFAEGLSRRELQILSTFIRKLSLSPTDRLLDELMLTAAEVKDHMPAAAWQDILDRFTRQANELLESSAGVVDSPRVRSLPRRGRVFSRETATQALADFSRTIPNDEIPWYVVSGTLLGLVREGGFLEHDYDIDLGVHAECVDFDAIIRRIDESDDFHVRKLDFARIIIPTEDGGCRLDALPIVLKITHRSGVFIDLFFHYREGVIRWHGSSVHRWDNTYFDLASYELAGVPVLGPADADRYLTENYGQWRVPIKEFNCSTGTPNAHVVKNLSAIAIFLRRLAFCRLNGDKAAAPLEAVLTRSGYLERGAGGTLLFTNKLLTRPPTQHDSTGLSA